MTNEQNNLEIVIEILELNDEEFTIKTLRKIQLLTKKINHYYNNNNISKLKKHFLYKLLKDTTNKKLLSLNPNINKEQVNSINQIFNFNYNQIPTDLTIIDNDIILYHETEYNNPYIDKTIILNSTNYTELPKLHTLYSMIKSYKNIYPKINYIDFSKFYNFYYPYDEKFNKNNPTLANMITYINELLFPISNTKEIITYSTPKNNIIYTSDIKILLNTNLETIIESIFKKKDINFNLIAITDWNDIYCFNITQKVFPNNTYTWHSNRIYPKIWNLTEEINKRNQHILTKQKNTNQN